MSRDDKDKPSTLCGNGSLFGVLVEINKAMIDIATILRASPNVQTATRGCDVREYHDFMQPKHKVQAFEAYVEAQARDGQMFVWAFELWKTAAGWNIHRSISKGEAGGAQVATSFRDLDFKKLHEFAANTASIIAELVDSAKTFDFPGQPDLRRQP
jgi:hypothetical protein